MSWPDLSDAPAEPDGPIPSFVHEFAFTGAAATFEVPDLSALHLDGTGPIHDYPLLTFYLRGGRGEGVDRRNFRVVGSIAGTQVKAGTWTVVVGGDAHGTAGGSGGGGNGSAATSELYTDGGGGGGGTFLIDPDGFVVGCAPGSGGACGGTVFAGRVTDEDGLLIGVPAEEPANWSEWWPLPTVAGYSRHPWRSGPGTYGWMEPYSRGAASTPFIGQFFEPDHTFAKGANGGAGGNDPASAGTGDYAQAESASYSDFDWTGTIGDEWDPTAPVTIDLPPELGGPQVVHGDFVAVTGAGASVGGPGSDGAHLAAGSGGAGATAVEGPGAGGGGGGIIGGGGGGNVPWYRPAFRSTIVDIYDEFTVNGDGSLYLDGDGHPVITRRVVPVAYRETWGIGPGGHGSKAGWEWSDPADVAADGKALVNFSVHRSIDEDQPPVLPPEDPTPPGWSVGHRVGWGRSG